MNAIVPRQTIEQIVALDLGVALRVGEPVQAAQLIVLRFGDGGGGVRAQDALQGGQAPEPVKAAHRGRVGVGA